MLCMIWGCLRYRQEWGMMAWGSSRINLNVYSYLYNYSYIFAFVFMVVSLILISISEGGRMP